MSVIIPVSELLLAGNSAVAVAGEIPAAEHPGVVLSAPAAWSEWEQWLTSLSVWGQFPVVFLIVVPLSVLVAWCVLRCVDAVGIPWENWIERRREKESQLSRGGSVAITGRQLASLPEGRSTRAEKDKKVFDGTVGTDGTDGTVPAGMRKRGQKDERRQKGQKDQKDQKEEQE